MSECPEGYCRSCPPHNRARLSRFNKGDTCGPCEKARRDRWMAKMRAEAAAERAAESCRDAVLRLLDQEPMTHRNLTDLTRRADSQVRQVLSELRKAGEIEFATMVGGINRYQLTPAGRETVRLMLDRLREAA